MSYEEAEAEANGRPVAKLAYEEEEEDACVSCASRQTVWGAAQGRSVQVGGEAGSLLGMRGVSGAGPSESRDSVSSS